MVKWGAGDFNLPCGREQESYQVVSSMEHTSVGRGFQCREKTLPILMEGWAGGPPP